MATNKFLTLINGVIQRVQAIASSSGAGDADKIVATGADGRLDPSLMPTGFGADTLTVTASEALSAGDYVNIHDSGGARVRKASAADATKPAHGFVLNNVSSGSPATVYFEGQNTALTGLTIAAAYILSPSTPGGVVIASTALSAGNTYQKVGDAVGTTTISTEIENPITIVA
jgi:hypothetical protein